MDPLRRSLSPNPHVRSLDQGPSNRAEYLESWARWRRDAPADEVEARAIAFERVREFPNNNRLEAENELDLRCLGLTTLPDRFPDTLGCLRVNHNRLSRLPDELPESLHKLYAGSNRLTCLPVRLPFELTVLSVPYNLLDSLPNPLPGNLRELCLDGNRLRALPPLPDSLIDLTASSNVLSVFPTPLPAGIDVLVLDSNLITALPDVAPDHSVTLSVCNNLITEVPESFVCYSRRETVYLDDNPLAERAMRLLFDPDNVSSDSDSDDLDSDDSTVSETGPRTPTPPRLECAVEALLGEAMSQPTQQHWQAISSEDNASAFARFLQRLGGTISAQSDPAFRQGLQPWLRQLADAPALRQQTFLIAQDATQTCEDRVTLKFNEMQVAALVYEVEHSRDQHRIDSVISAGLEIFRLEALEKIAREHASRIGARDELEVYLAFQTGLRSHLPLHTVAPRMAFQNASGVSPDDLRQALARVREGEAAGFADWFFRWPPWRNALRHIAPGSHERIARHFEATHESECVRRTQTRLSELKLDGDPDAEVAVGRQVMDELECAMGRALTEAFIIEQFQRSLRAAEPGMPRPISTRGGTSADPSGGVIDVVAGTSGHAGAAASARAGATASATGGASATASAPASLPAVCLRWIENLLGFAVRVPAIASLAACARDAQGNHIGSQIAKLVAQGGPSPLAEAYLSLLRALLARQHLAADAAIELVLPSRSDDPVESLAHAVVGSAWDSAATRTLCALLADVASVAPMQRPELLRRMSLQQAGYDFPNLHLEQRADFYKRAKRADAMDGNAEAIALLRQASLIPADRELYRRGRMDDLAAATPVEDYAALLRRVKAQIGPAVSAMTASRAVERAQLADASRAAQQWLQQQDDTQREASRARAETAARANAALLASRLADHVLSESRRRAAAGAGSNPQNRRGAFGPHSSSTAEPSSAGSALAQTGSLNRAAMDAALAWRSPTAGRVSNPTERESGQMLIHEADEHIRRRLDELRGHDADESIRQRLLRLRTPDSAETTRARSRAGRDELAPPLPRD
ncbi:NEL-type E3 ubiquitin ligase domain-containing protein [Chitinasiproducens palmae]|nr:NEL-type E3 ubiquitin ligase domain-containing protein [Chitinasiproducens palmae]